jgi:hypothetical protein
MTERGGRGDAGRQRQRRRERLRQERRERRERAGDGPGNLDPEDPYSGTREEMERAIRRLDVLEWVILLAAVVFAIGGGALVAWMLSEGAGLAFRPTWIVLSILLLVVPGGIVMLRERGK